MSLDTQGIQSLRREINSLKSRLSSDLEQAVKSEAETVLQISRSIAPRDEGTLIADSGLEISRDSDNSVVASLWYGRGPAADYALSTHETPSEHDPPTWQGKRVTFQRGGQSKYLERPMMNAEDGFPDRVAKRMKL